MGLRMLGGVVVGMAFAVSANAAESFSDLAARCAPSVHPQTLRAVVRQESAFNPLAIGVNGPGARSVKPRDLAEATAIATKLIAGGASVDLGLGQINSKNLEWLGLSVAEAFEPCTNLRAAARVLTQNYVRERPKAPNDQVALDRALSRYNTGNPHRGITNGYVAKVRGRATSAEASAPLAAGAAQTPPAWDLFGQARMRRAEWDVFAAAAARAEGGVASRGAR